MVFSSFRAGMATNSFMGNRRGAGTARITGDAVTAAKRSCREFEVSSKRSAPQASRGRFGPGRHPANPPAIGLAETVESYRLIGVANIIGPSLPSLIDPP